MLPGTEKEIHGCMDLRFYDPFNSVSHLQSYRADRKFIMKGTRFAGEKNFATSPVVSNGKVQDKAGFGLYY